MAYFRLFKKKDRSVRPVGGASCDLLLTFVFCDLSLGFYTLFFFVLFLGFTVVL